MKTLYTYTEESDVPDFVDCGSVLICSVTKFALAVLKDKSKKLLSKGKNKVYGQIDLLKNKID